MYKKNYLSFLNFLLRICFGQFRMCCFIHNFLFLIQNFLIILKNKINFSKNIYLIYLI